MKNRFRRSVVIILVAAMFFTQNAGTAWADTETVSDNGSFANEEQQGEEALSGNSDTVEEAAAEAEAEDPASGYEDPGMKVIKSISVSEVKSFGNDPYVKDIQVSSTVSQEDFDEYYKSEKRNDIRWVILFKPDEDNNQNLSFSGENKSITAADVKSSGWEIKEIGTIINKKQNEYFKEFVTLLTGAEICDGMLTKGLMPGTEYSCYLALKYDGDDSGIFYGKTGKERFSTSSGRDHTSVEGSVFSQKYQLFGRRINIKINQDEFADEEYIAGFYYAPANLNNSTITIDEIGSDENKGFVTKAEEASDDAWTEDYEYQLWDYESYLPYDKDITSRDHIYAVVFTGDEAYKQPDLVLVDMGKVDTKKPAAIDKDHVHVSYETGISSIKVTVSYDCGGDITDFVGDLALKVSINQAGRSFENVYYNDSLEESYLKWKKTENGVSTVLNISAAGDPESGVEEGFYIEPETTYGLQTAIGSYDLDDGFSSIYEADPESVTTLQDVRIDKSEFDEDFLNYLVSECGIEINEGKVSQKALNRITEIVEENFSSEYYLTSIKGIKYLTNLREININSHRIQDISELANCKLLRSLESIENSIQKLPDLSGLSELTYLNLNWNYIPDDEIKVSKLPESLEHWDEDERVFITRESIAENLKETQYKKSNFVSGTLYTDIGSGKYPFQMTVKDHKLRPYNLDRFITGGDYKRGSFYVFKAVTKNAEADSEATQKVGIVNSKMSITQEDIDDFKETYGLDEVYDARDKKAAYAFNVASVAGITAAGTHPVSWKLYKRNAWIDGETGKTVSVDHLLWEDTVTAVYGNGTVTAVKVSPKTLNLSTGHSAKLTADITAFPENASVDRSVSWTTGDSKIAAVDEQGNVTGISPGTTTITATSKANSTLRDSCTVTVKNVTPTGFIITTTDGKDTTFVGSKLTLKPVFTPADASVDVSKIRYETKDTKIVSVSGSELTGLAEGTAVINGSCTVSEGNVLTAQFTVKIRRKAEENKTFYTVRFLSDNKAELYSEAVLEGQPASEPAFIKPEKPEHLFAGWGLNGVLFDFTNPVNSDLTLTAIFKKSRVETTENTGSGMDSQPDTDLKKEGSKITGNIYLVKGQSYTLENPGSQLFIDNTTVVKIANSRGTMIAKQAGEATVTSKNHELKVFVMKPALAVSKVAGKEAAGVNPKNVKILLGETAEFKIDGITKNAEKYPITWHSSNVKVATVNNGVVTTIGKGSSYISAFIGGMQYRGMVKVTDTIKAPDKISNAEAVINVNAMKSVYLKFSSFNKKGSSWKTADGYKELAVTKTDNKGNPAAWRNDIIEITNQGKLTGIGEGQTVIVGTDSQGNNVKITVNVKVIKTNAAFVLKDKTMTVKFLNVNSKNSQWFSSDPSKVTVDNSKSKGKVKGIAAGSSAVSCSVNNSNDLVFETIVYCEDPQLKTDEAGKLKINSKGKGLTGTLSLDAGEVYRIETSGIYQTPSFKSSNKAAVFVDENGLIYARKKGKKANVTAKVNGKTIKIAVTVNQ